MNSLAFDANRVGICVEGLCKTFGQQVIFHDFNLSFTKGQITALVGANGCGKSTLLNVLSGLIPYDRGRITISGKPLHRARIGYVFQNYQASLFPWLSAWENLLYPLKLQGIPKSEQRSRIESITAIGEIRFDLHRYPYQLSGGQQQLIAILRAVIAAPDVLFLDEPFSSLDLAVTLDMRDHVQHLCDEFGLTTIMVSHHLDDAMYLSDRIVLVGHTPLQIAAQIPVPLPRPRTRTVLADPDFAQIKRHCLDVFQQAFQR